MNSHHNNWMITYRIQSPTSTSLPTAFEIIIGRKPCGGGEEQSQTQGHFRLQVLQLDLKHSPLLHPPIDGQMRSIISYLVGAYPGIIEWSYEQWEEYIRKQPDLGFEIDHWMAVDRAFTNHAGGKPLDYQMEVFRLLILHCIPLANLDAADIRYVRLTDDDVNSILDDYYAYYVEG